jgi:hypothetical protein
MCAVVTRRNLWSPQSQSDSSSDVLGGDPKDDIEELKETHERKATH